MKKIALFLTLLLSFPSFLFAEDVEDFLSKWKKIQETGDVAGYKNLCTPAFQSTVYYNTIVNDLLANKYVKSLNIKSAKMEIIAQIDKVIVSPIPCNIVAPGDTVRETLKYLDLQRDADGKLKIKEEKFVSLPVNDIIKSSLRNMDALNTSFTDQLIIEQLLEGWQTAWENKNIEEYLSFYQSDAEITRITVIDGKLYNKTLNKLDLKTGMQKLFERFSWIDIRIEDVSVYGDSMTMKADFKQIFAGHGANNELAYQDLGKKNLIFTKNTAGDWKIKFEREEKIIDLKK